MNPVKIIRLTDGTDIVATVSTEGESHTLFSPMMYGFDSRSGEDNLVMQHFLPVRLIERNEVTIPSDDVFFMIDPDDEFTEFYLGTVEKIEELYALRDSIASNTDTLKQVIMDSFDSLDIGDLPMQ
jgi:hypothetical protein